MYFLSTQEGKRQNSKMCSAEDLTINHRMLLNSSFQEDMSSVLIMKKQD